MRISTFIIGLIVFTMVVTGSTFFTASLVDRYGIDDSNVTVDNYNYVSEFQELAIETKNGTDTKGGAVDVVSDIFASGVRAISISVKSMGLTIRILSDAQGDPAFTGLGWFFVGLTSIVIIGVIFVLISAIMKYDV